MTSTTEKDARPGGLSSLVYDPKARGLFFQIALLAAVVLGLLWIVDNTITNLAAQGKKSGFGFLDQTGGFQILTTLGTFLFDYQAGVSTYWDIFWIGVANTLVVAFLGIVAATILGFIIGVFRLSSNVILRGFATVYIELLRNLPLLLQIFFWYFFVLRALPDKRDRVTAFGETFGLNITGLYGPFPILEDGFSVVLWALAGAIALAFLIGWWAKKRQEATGRQFPTFWVNLGVLVLVPVAAFLYVGWQKVAGGGGAPDLASAWAAGPLTWEHPVFKEDGPMLRRGYEGGLGMVVKPEFISLWLALTLYTASFIAEIVRAGILAVPHGQTEAANALGIRPNHSLRLVIIPQALRVIIPPLTSQYLNLTKNSSLAVAIAYPDVVSVFAGTALNQVGQEIEMIFMMMMVYLAISIATSLFMNWYNARIALVER